MPTKCLVIFTFEFICLFFSNLMALYLANTDDCSFLFRKKNILLFRVIIFNQCGGLNMYDPHRIMCLNAWSIGSGTIRRCGLVGGSVSLWG